MTTTIIENLLGPMCELFYKYKKARELYQAYINTIRGYGFSTDYSLNFGFELYDPFDINNIKLQPGVFTTNSSFVSYPNLSSSGATTIDVNNLISLQDLTSSGINTVTYENKTLPIQISITATGNTIVGIASNFYTSGIPYKYNEQLDEKVIRSFESEIISDSTLAILIFVNLERTTFVGINTNWNALETSLYTVKPISYRYNNGYSQYFSYSANKEFIRTNPTVDSVTYDNLYNTTYSMVYNWLNYLTWTPSFLEWISINYIYVNEFLLMFLEDYFDITLSGALKTFGYNAGAAVYGRAPANWTLVEIKAAIDAIKATGSTAVRIDFGVKDSMNLTMVGEYEPVQKEFHRLIFEYLAQNEMQPIIVINSDVQSQYAYRLALDNYLGIVSYVNDTNGFIAATYRRKVKIPEVFWPVLNYHMSEILELGADVYGRNGRQWEDFAIVDIDNETAYVIDSDYAADPSIPYGTYPPSYADMMADRLDSLSGMNFYGAIFVPGAYENQSGIATELATGGGSWRGNAAWENVHIYVAWVLGDTKYTIADKMLDELEDFLARLDALNDPYRSGKSVVITEIGATNIPLSSREEILTYCAEALTEHSRVISVQSYTMIENLWNGSSYPASSWAVLDYEYERYGPGGYPGYSAAYPSSWNWAGYTWNSPTDWSVAGIYKQKECVHTVDTNLTVHFKKWLNVTNFYWSESYATGPNLGYGTYTFRTETDLNNLGENVIFSLSLYGSSGAGNTSNPIGGAGEIQIVKVGEDGEGTAKVEVYTGDGVNPVLAGSQDYPGVLPQGELIFVMEYRATFIRWNWYSSSGENIFSYRHDGFVPDPSVMNNYVRIGLSSVRNAPILITKPQYVGIGTFSYSP